MNFWKTQLTTTFKVGLNKLTDPSFLYLKTTESENTKTINGEKFKKKNVQYYVKKR